jgi:hypothetical protein
VIECRIWPFMMIGPWCLGAAGASGAATALQRTALLRTLSGARRWKPVWDGAGQPMGERAPWGPLLGPHQSQQALRATTLPQAPWRAWKRGGERSLHSPCLAAVCMEQAPGRACSFISALCGGGELVLWLCCCCCWWWVLVSRGALWSSQVL